MGVHAADVLPIELWTLVLLQLYRWEASRTDKTAAIHRAAHVCRAFNAICMNIYVQVRHDSEPHFWSQFTLSTDRKHATMELGCHGDDEILRLWLYPPTFESLSVIVYRTSWATAHVTMLRVFVSRCLQLRTLRVSFERDIIPSYVCNQFWYDKRTSRRVGLSACCGIASSVARLAGDGTARVLVLTGTANGTLMCSPSELERWRLDLYHFLPPPPSPFRKRKDNSPKRSPTQINTLIWPKTPTKDASEATRQALSLLEARAMDICVVDDDPASEPFALLKFDATRVTELDLGSPERGIAPLYYPALLPRLSLPALKVLAVRRGEIPAETLRAFLMQHAILEEIHLHKSSPQYVHTPLLDAPLALPAIQKLVAYEVSELEYLLFLLDTSPKLAEVHTFLRFPHQQLETLNASLMRLSRLPETQPIHVEIDIVRSGLLSRWSKVSMSNHTLAAVRSTNCVCIRSIAVFGLHSPEQIGQTVPWLLAFPRIEDVKYNFDAGLYVRCVRGSKRMLEKAEDRKFAKCMPWLQPLFEAVWERKRAQAYFDGKPDSFPDKCPPLKIKEI
ncbi:hypothetical protein MKEN_01154100 [Mycena kentingensis (nom. inval.)]|nr:hypothetical protein MKEN_01154100 [Mycena kentingensis (nom. inval.)]